MSKATQEIPIGARRIVCEIPGMDAVTVLSDLAYHGSSGEALSFDLYSAPGQAPGTLRPTVVFVSGYADPGGKLKKMGAYTSWARLLAASGLRAIAYTNRDPVLDLTALFRHLSQHAEALGIDAQRLGAWACSGNAPTALTLAMRGSSAQLTCLVLCYAFLLDTGDSRSVSDAAKKFGFADACQGKSMGDLASDLPLMLVRAGHDEMPGLNAALDRFVTEALAHNLPLSFCNHASAPHAFDLLDDSDTSREMIGRVLGFLHFHLRAPV